MKYISLGYLDSSLVFVAVIRIGCVVSLKDSLVLSEIEIFRQLGFPSRRAILCSA